MEESRFPYQVFFMSPLQGKDNTNRVALFEELVRTN